MNSDNSIEKNELNLNDENSIENLISNFNSLKITEFESQMDSDDLQRYQRALKILSEPDDVFDPKKDKKKYKFSVIKQSKEKQQEKQSIIDQLEKEKKEEKKLSNEDKRKSLKKQASSLFGGKKIKTTKNGSDSPTNSNLTKTKDSNSVHASPEKSAPQEKKIIKEIINREGFDYPPEFVEGTSPVLQTKYIPKEYPEDDMSEEAQFERKREKIRRKTLKARPRVHSRSDSLKQPSIDE